MRKFYSILFSLLLTASIFAQTPQKMSYQAVIRNSSNQLVVNHEVGMKISILQGSVTGSVVYTEILTPTPTTNANGLVSVEIGGASGFNSINWAGSTYFIKAETDPTGGTNYTITGISQLLSVPYALHSKTVDFVDYSAISNKPTLFDGTWTSLTGKPTLFDGSYNSLSNKPTLFDGTWSSLAGKPTFALVATTGNYSDLTGLPTLFNGDYNSLSSKPTLFDGAWSSLSGKPTFAVVATSGSFADLANKPVDATSTSSGFLSATDKTKLDGLHNADGSETKITAGTNVNVSGTGTSANPYIVNSGITGTNVGDLQYWNGTSWVKLAPGSTGQVLTINSSNIPSWQNLPSTALLPATVTNQAASIIQSFSATLNGTVNANGLSTTVAFEWGLTTSYGNSVAVSQSPVTGMSNVAISHILTGLQSNTTYHYRIVATNAVNVSYSSDMSFKTAMSAPQLSTTGITSIQAFTATSGGNVTYDGGSTVTSRGVCWSTSTNPTTASSKVLSGTGTGSFVSNLTGLTTNTLYYVRAFATNGAGTTYGNEISFSTNVVDGSGNEYSVRNIGSQVWMGENLNADKYNDGTPISNITDITAWQGLTTGAYCIYDNTLSNADIYGKLYNWYAVNTSTNGGKNVCPINWHVPSDAEWLQLENFISVNVIDPSLTGYRGDAGFKIKTVNDWYSGNGLSTDEFGFSALPGGGRENTTGNFNNITKLGIWWTKSEENSTNAWFRTLKHSESGSARFSGEKKAGYSVRCVKD